MLLRLAWVGTYVQTQHDDHDDVVGQGSIDIIHDQTLAISEQRLAVDVGLTRRFSASLMIPVRIVATTIRYLDTDGAEVDLVTPSIHHRNQTLTGLADPMVLGAVTGALGPLRLTARAGVTLPFGSTQENPFVLGDRGQPHEHIQMGTGTINPVLAVEASHGWGAWRLGGFAFTQQTVYANAKGYQAGDRYAGGVTLLRRLGDHWSVRAGAEVQGETAERWGGMVPTDDGNRGRVTVIPGAGASWSVTDHLALDLALKVPVVTYVVGGQLAMPAIVELGASWSFGGPTRAPAAHEDAHEHGEHEHGHGD
ncbi:MAG: hypothetical protein H0T79_23585, partial [Deltaproteobacteria bacterium]|nr:hypothetical protein [Deltaproteobacteria bacterium]